MACEEAPKCEAMEEDTVPLVRRHPVSRRRHRSNRRWGLSRWWLFSN
jgi:hypothetical protein